MYVLFLAAGMGRYDPGSVLRRGPITSGLLPSSDWPADRPVLLSGCRPQGLGHGAAGRSTVGSLVCDWSATGRAGSSSEPGSRRMGFHSESDDWSTLPSVQLSLAERRAGLLRGSADGADGVGALDLVVGWRAGGEPDEAAGRAAG